MSAPRSVALYDPARETAWNENMSQDEFAVHASGVHGNGAAYCTVLGNLRDAEAFAEQAVIENPTLRYRIYGAEGFVGAPVYELRGAQYKGDGEISVKVRRWGGGGLLGVGLALVAVDWASGFQLSWPALVGSRLLVPGAVLLITEALLLLNEKQKASQAARQQAGKQQA